MIITEYYKTRKDGVVLNRTYSDAGFYILQNETGIEYSEAVDVEGAPYTYSETDKPIETEEATEADYIHALNEMGVDV
jgi:hypothetical protein